MSNEHYLHNPLIHQHRRLGESDAVWVRQFDCTHIRPLIICRGPIRKEAMEIIDRDNILRGARAEVEFDKEISRLLSDNSGKRVTGVLTP